MLRADCLRFYGLEPEEIPAEQLFEMIASMPRGSRTLALLYPETAWSDAEYLLAQIDDVLQAILWSLSDGKGKKPTPVDRPGRKKEDKKKSNRLSLPVSELHSYFEKFE